MYAGDPPNIAARRMEEDRLADARAVVAGQAVVGKMAQFEIRTAGKIQSRVAKERVERGKAVMAEQLNRRRARLARMLETERQQLQAEIEASFETPEQLKERMFARARELQAKREADRMATLKDLEEKRWRQQSDLLRARDSELTVKRTTEERAAQLREKEEALAREAEEAARFAEHWKRDAEAREARELEEKAKRSQANSALREELDRLTTMRREMSEAEKEHAREQDRMTMDQWKAIDHAEAERLAEKKRRNAEEHARVMAMNKEHAEKRAIEAAREFADDKVRLKATLDREAAQEQAERDFAAQLKAEAQAHRRALVEQMAIQAEETGYLDDMQREFEEAMWKKRQDQWDAEAEARRRLMREVDETRQAQLREKDYLTAAEREAAAREAEELKRKIAAEDAAEMERVAGVKERLRMQQEHVREQMAQKERATRMQKQQDYLEVKLMQKEERKYVAKVDELLAAPAPATQFRRKKSQWFY